MDKKSNKPQGDIVAAIDVGSTKVSCFIATIEADGRPHVIGVGQLPSRGLRAGAITDMESARESIAGAVHHAEKLADETVRSVVVNLSGGKPQSEMFALEVPISGHEVGQHDLRKVLDQGSHFQKQSDRELIHSIPIGFRIDGSRGIRDPRGMFGEKLGVDIHVISAQAGAVRNLATCIGGCHLNIEALVVSPYASGLACLVGDEMDLGVTLIDMGGGTTSIAVFEDGEIVFTDSVLIGGSAVTMDIAQGLSTPVAEAERMKILYGSAKPQAGDDQAVIDVPQIGDKDRTKANYVPKSLVTGIVQPRLEETFELVRNRLEASGYGKSAGRRVVLTGGASQMQGVRDLAAHILDKHVRLGKPQRHDGLAEAVAGPAFATCAGLLTFAAQKQADGVMAVIGKTTNGKSGVFGRLGRWIHQNF
ncbi:MAG: cell division protein FtsA [Alphaproteobacteria bacterium]